MLVGEIAVTEEAVVEAGQVVAQVRGGVEMEGREEFGELGNDAGVGVGGVGGQVGVEFGEYLILHEHLDHRDKLSKVDALMEFPTN